MQCLLRLHYAMHKPNPMLDSKAEGCNLHADSRPCAAQALLPTKPRAATSSPPLLFLNLTLSVECGGRISGNGVVGPPTSSGNYTNNLWCRLKYKMGDGAQGMRYFQVMPCQVVVQQPNTMEHHTRTHNPQPLH